MKINITKTQRAKLVKDWLNDMFSDVEMMNGYYYVKNKNDQIVSYKKKLANQDDKNKEFWFDYDLIWSFLQPMFSLKYNELQSITKDWVEETLNLKDYNTDTGRIRNWKETENGLKLN